MGLGWRVSGGRFAGYPRRRLPCRLQSARDPLHRRAFVSVQLARRTRAGPVLDMSCQPATAAHRKVLRHVLTQGRPLPGGRRTGSSTPKPAGIRSTDLERADAGKDRDADPTVISLRDVSR
jgi:hypothetical protein